MLKMMGVSGLLRSAGPFVGVGVFLLCAGACSEGERPDFEQEGEAHLDPGSLAQSSTWRVAGEPTQTLGAVADDGPETFARVRGAQVRQDGGLAVLDGSTGELRMFSKGGGYIGAVGRRGGGPGEFMDPYLLPGQGDTAIVYDRSRRTVTVIDLSSLTVHSMHDAGTNLPVGSRLIGRCGAKWLAMYEVVTMGGASGLQKVPAKASLLLFEAAGVTQDTVGVFDGAYTFVMFDDIGQSTSEPQPFTWSPRVAVGDDRIVVTSSHSDSIRYYGCDGRPSAEFQYRGALPEVDERVVRAHIDSRLRIANSAAHDWVRTIYAAMPFPKTLPPFGAVIMDSTGNAWVELVNPGWWESSRWLIIDRDLVMLGAIELPLGIRLLAVTESEVVGLERSELDVEIVRRYTIQRLSE